MVLFAILCLVSAGVICFLISDGQEKEHIQNFKKELVDDAKIKKITTSKGILCISETGDISYKERGKEDRFHIKDVIGIEILNGNQSVSSISNVVVGGVLFGGVGAVLGALGTKKKDLKLVVRLNDFDKPQITLSYGNFENSLQTTISLLSVVENKLKES